jgi:hypothetical protein
MRDDEEEVRVQEDVAGDGTILVENGTRSPTNIEMIANDLITIATILAHLEHAFLGDYPTQLDEIIQRYKKALNKE